MCIASAAGETSVRYQRLKAACKDIEITLDMGRGEEFIISDPIWVDKINNHYVITVRAEEDQVIKMIYPEIAVLSIRKKLIPWYFNDKLPEETYIRLAEEFYLVKNKKYKCLYKRKWIHAVRKIRRKVKGLCKNEIVAVLLYKILLDAPSLDKEELYELFGSDVVKLLRQTSEDTFEDQTVDETLLRIHYSYLFALQEMRISPSSRNSNIVKEEIEIQMKRINQMTSNDVDDVADLLLSDVETV